MEEKTAPGFTAAKAMITLMFGINIAGHKLKPVAIYHALNPRALKGIDHNYMPVHWYANSKGWMTSGIMQDYVHSKARMSSRSIVLQRASPARF